MATAVMDAVEDFRGAPPTDDTAVLVVRVTEQARRGDSPLAVPGTATLLGLSSTQATTTA